MYMSLIKKIIAYKNLTRMEGMLPSGVQKGLEMGNLRIHVALSLIKLQTIYMSLIKKIIAYKNLTRMEGMLPSGVQKGLEMANLTIRQELR